MNHVARRLSTLTGAVAAVTLSLVTMTASATEPPAAPAGQIAVGEVAETQGLDTAAMRSTAEGELAQIDASKLPQKRRYVVSLSFARTATGDNVACTVNALLRDAKTGAMIAIIEAGAQATGTSSKELSLQLAHAAVRSAMRRIPTALGTK